MLDLEPGYALFDSAQLEDGMHTLTAALAQGGETRVVTATFLVDNSGAWRDQLLVSFAPERTEAEPLAGQTLSDEVYIFLVPEAEPEQITFSLDGDVLEVAGTPSVERVPFYDFARTRPDGLAAGFGVSALSAGEHTVTADITSASGDVTSVKAQFVVGESANVGEPPPAPANFQRWSDSATWGGQVPSEGADVTITEDQAVLLDADVTLGRVSVAGTLRCAERDLDVKADLIMVTGRFECGTAEEPFTNSLFLTLTGNEGQTTMMMGAKVLGVMAGGVLSLHAQPRPSWSRLNRTAQAGDSAVSVADASGWRVGDEIVIASTDFDYEQAETRVITAVSGNRVELDEPLEFMHYGETQSFGGKTLDERAEVGLLSRSITVQGDEASEEDGFGGHVMVMEGGRAELAHIELRRMGQRGEQGRYPLHFHLNGDTSRGSYLRGSSVHASFNRCVTIHGSNGVEVVDNVAYDAPGHCYFLEDGIETGNVFRGNLGLSIYEPEEGDTLLPSDDGFLGPAVYWITNPDNTYEDNVAAGSAGTGFWIALPEHPTGPSATDDVWPRQTPLGSFSGNVAHSNRTNGLHVDNGPDENLETEVTSYRPRKTPGDDESDAVEAVFADFTAYKNRNRGVWLRGYNLALEEAMLADNAIGATFAADETVLRESVLVGESANLGTPRNYEINENRVGEDGRSLPRPFAPDFPIRGFEYYDGKVGAESSFFTRFEPNARREASALSTFEFTAFPMSPESYAQGLSFAENTKRVYMAPVPDDPSENPADGYRSTVFRDIDGSVTGTRERFVTYDNRFLVTDNCQERSDWNMWVCDEAYARLSISTEGERGTVTLRRGGAAHVMYGVGGSPADSFVTNILPERTYDLELAGGTPRRFSVTLQEGSGRSVTVRVPYAGQPKVTRFGQEMEAYSSVGALSSSAASGYAYSGGTLHLKLVAESEFERLSVE